MGSWNSQQYLLFEKERTQPAIDLAMQIDMDEPRRIVDIGCGPGNSTAVLARRFPKAYILGVDNSPDMIAAAQKSYPQFEFELCDAGSELPALGKDFDVVFSNACIQWIPDHHKLIPEMMNLLRICGVLAVQTPMNYQEPIHRIIEDTITSVKWQSYFPQPRIFHNLQQEEYFDLLASISANFRMWMTIYMHRLKSPRAVLDWYRSTGLRPYLNSLPDDKKEEFEMDIYTKLLDGYPVQMNEEVIFRFPRFFFIAVK